MARQQKYNEPTVMFSKRVPESKLKQVGELVTEFLAKIKPIETKHVPVPKGGKSGDVAAVPVPNFKSCDCYLDDKGLFRRGKSGCKMIKQEHKFLKL